MAENLAEGFVDLRCLGLAPQRVSKLRLDHAVKIFAFFLSSSVSQMRL
jgi:hypothetical protein